MGAPIEKIECIPSWRIELGIRDLEEGQKRILYGIYKNDGQIECGDIGFSEKKHYSFGEEASLLAGIISRATDIGFNLQSDGRIRTYASKILEWGMYRSCTDFHAKFWKDKEWKRKFWMEEDSLRIAHETLVKLNIYNILGFRIGIQKEERSYPAKTSEDDVE